MAEQCPMCGSMTTHAVHSGSAPLPGTSLADEGTRHKNAGGKRMSSADARRRGDDMPPPDPESGEPGGGRGRRDEPGRTGIWPMSGPLPPSPDAPTVAQGDLGRGIRGFGAEVESGTSEMVGYRRDPVCGSHVHPEHAAATVDWNDMTYFFDSVECRRRFDEAPPRYAGSLAHSPPPGEPHEGQATPDAARGPAP